MFEWDYVKSKGCKQVKELFLSINSIDVFMEKITCDLMIIAKLFYNRNTQQKQMIMKKPNLRKYLLFKVDIYSESYKYLKNRKKQ